MKPLYEPVEEYYCLIKDIYINTINIENNEVINIGSYIDKLRYLRIKLRSFKDKYIEANKENENFEEYINGTIKIEEIFEETLMNEVFKKYWKEWVASGSVEFIGLRKNYNGAYIIFTCCDDNTELNEIINEKVRGYSKELLMVENCCKTLMDMMMEIDYYTYNEKLWSM